jgi:TPR repeat protein
MIDAAQPAVSRRGSIAEGYVMLGEMYEVGSGSVKQDVEAALQHYHTAAALHGSTYACVRGAQLHTHLLLASSPSRAKGLQQPLEHLPPSIKLSFLSRWSRKSPIDWLVSMQRMW